VGQWFEGMAHGKGTMTFPNGKKKKGMFRNGKFVEEKKGVKQAVDPDLLEERPNGAEP
jgi:hypothetical protein